MATNTYKIPDKNTVRKGFFSVIEKFMQIDESISQVIHVRFMPQLVFVSVLCILYIGNRHYAEKKTRAISILENQVEDLRADYTTLKADYMFDSKQSEVAKRAKALGLDESSDPPFKIVIERE